MNKLVYIVIVVFLTACSTLNASSLRPSFKQMAVHYNKVASDANNELMLLNILRAQTREALYYSSLSEMRGSLTYSGAGSIGGTFNQNGVSSTGTTTGTTTDPAGFITTSIAETVSGGLDVISPRIEGRLSSTPSFTYELLDTQEFMQGINASIPLDTIHLYLDQGWNPELLGALLIENVTFTAQVMDGKNVKQDNKKKDIEIVFHDIGNYAYGTEKHGFGHFLRCYELAPTESKASSDIELDLSKLNLSTIEGLSSLAGTDWKVSQRNVSGTDKNELILKKESSSDRIGINSVEEGSQKCSFLETLQEKEKKYLYDKLNLPASDLVRFEYNNSMNIDLENDIAENFTIRRYESSYVDRVTGRTNYQNVLEEYPVRITLKFAIRSTQNVIYFLGQYVRYEKSTDNKFGVYALHQPHTKTDNPEMRNWCLFQVSTERVNDPYIVAELNNDRYFIPRYKESSKKKNKSADFEMRRCDKSLGIYGEGNKNTYNIIAFLNQMINLQKNSQNRPRSISVTSVPG